MIVLRYEAEVIELRHENEMNVLWYEAAVIKLRHETGNQNNYFAAYSHSYLLTDIIMEKSL